MKIFITVYFLTINIIAAITFYSDKVNAVKSRKRVPEKTLHLFEIAGGVFAILLLMFTIRHKNQKKAYYLWTYLIFAIWILLLGFLIYKQIG